MQYVESHNKVVHLTHPRMISKLLTRKLKINHFEPSLKIPSMQYSEKVLRIGKVNDLLTVPTPKGTNAQSTKGCLTGVIVHLEALKYGIDIQIN